MTAPAIAPPAPDEYAPFYAGYISDVIESDVLALLERQSATLRTMCDSVSDGEALTRYAPGKWSVKEVIGHMTDAERIFAYRALRISRGDPAPLEGFDENLYVAAAASDRRPLSELLEEFETARTATVSLLRSLRPEELERRGVANHVPVSVRALVFIIAGHVDHHLRILRERYKVGARESGTATA
jgi:uncharacterized damage-inducible protein DinB